MASASPGRSPRWPWIAALALIGVAAAIAALVWGTRSRGAAAAVPGKLTSRAAAHLPDGCEALLRVDFRRALSVPGVRARLAPALVEVSGASPTSAPARALKAADIDPARDISELTVCMAGDEAARKFAFVITGELGAEVAVPAIASTDAPPPEISSLLGRKLASKKEPNGEVTLVTQAEDGAIIVSNDPRLLEAAARVSDRAAEYGLAAEPEIAVAVGPGLFRLLARPDGALAALSQVHKARGGFSLATARGTLRLSPSGGTAVEAVAQDVRRAQGELRALGPGQFGELAAVSDAAVRVEEAEVVVDLTWTAAGVEQMVERIAGALVK